MHRLRLLALIGSCACAITLATAGVADAQAVAAEGQAVAAQALAERLLPRAEEAGPVTTIEVESTSLREAEIAMAYEPQNVITTSDEDVQLVVAHGHFIDGNEPTPAGAPAPSGTVMAFLVEHGQATGTYVGERALRVGSVLSKTNVPAATAARAARRRKASRREMRDRARARAAEWGYHCIFAEGRHCYAIAEWAMGSSEYVLGTETLQ
jgi:hypothetical protein